MKVLQRENHLRNVKLGSVLLDTLFGLLLERAEKFTTCAILHHEEQKVLRLERVVHGNDERMIGRHQNVSLCHRSLDLFSSQHFIFAQHLHCKQFAVRLLLHQVHSTSVPLAQQFEDFEILRPDGQRIR
eukprot:Lithocolla_globosa_v1_NODE_3183_length_1738_cov_15.576946.p2 type:complete len:129 gc:universal NODE_3183_length_1738_cov_15.576946:769-383(-)